MKSIGELLTELNIRKSGQKMVRDWKSMLPVGSRWHPGDPGDPACQICEGIGYLRVDLPVGHPDFGKLLLCYCVKVLPPMEPITSNYPYQGTVFDRGVGER